MSRFNNVTYSASSQTASIGAGLVWDDVYAALEPFNVSVVGGRVSGVGVAGFTLGGGEFIGNIFGIACSDHFGFHPLKDTRGSRVSMA